MVGIDWNAPLELMDGTPVRLSTVYGFGRDDDGDYYLVFDCGELDGYDADNAWCVSPDGRKHSGLGNDILVRNRVTDAEKRLRDAAPDLLEALRAVMNRHASNVLFHDRALAERCWSAIAKATGQCADIADGQPRSGCMD